MLLTDLALIVIGDAKFKLLSHPLVLSALVEIILMFAAAVASNAPIAPVPALAKNTMPFPRDPFVVGEPDSPSIQIFPEPLSKVTFFCMKIPAPEVDALAAVAPLHVHRLPAAQLLRRIENTVEY